MSNLKIQLDSDTLGNELSSSKVEIEVTVYCSDPDLCDWEFEYESLTVDGVAMDLSNLTSEQETELQAAVDDTIYNNGDILANAYADSCAAKADAMIDAYKHGDYE